jgi:hypothetical protein
MRLPTSFSVSNLSNEFASLFESLVFARGNAIGSKFEHIETCALLMSSILFSLQNLRR